MKADLNEAIKAKDETKSLVLRAVIASIQNKEKEKRYAESKKNPNASEADLEKSSFLSEEELIDVFASEAKKRRESIVEFEKGKRNDLVQKEKKELEILQTYLPEQMPEEELKKIVKEAISKTGAQTMKDMGKVMAELMPKVKGRADGGLISKIVKESLSC